MSPKKHADQLISYKGKAAFLVRGDHIMHGTGNTDDC